MSRKTTVARYGNTEARYVTDVDEWRAGVPRPDLDMRGGAVESVEETEETGAGETRHKHKNEPKSATVEDDNTSKPHAGDDD